jgi:hypothetical protein
MNTPEPQPSEPGHDPPPVSEPEEDEEHDDPPTEAAGPYTLRKTFD